MQSQKTLKATHTHTHTHTLTSVEAIFAPAAVSGLAPSTSHTHTQPSSVQLISDVEPFRDSGYCCYASTSPSILLRIFQPRRGRAGKPVLPVVFAQESNVPRNEPLVRANTVGTGVKLIHTCRELLHIAQHQPILAIGSAQKANGFSNHQLFPAPLPARE